MIFNIGPLEFILILLVAIIVLGPERMVSGARTFGRWIYKLVRSPTWRAIMTTSQEIRDLPNKIVRESGIEESLKEIQSVSADLNSEISQAVKDVNDEVSQAASAVSAEVSQAVKDVNAELKQSAQEVNQAASAATVEANQTIQAAASESQPVKAQPDATAQPEAASLPDAGADLEAASPIKEITPAETGDLDQAVVPVEQPVMVLQDMSAVEPAALPNNGHSQESTPEALAQESAASEVTQSPQAVEAPKVPKVRRPRKAAKAAPTAVEAVPREEEPSIQPPESPAAHIKIE